MKINEIYLLIFFGNISTLNNFSYSNKYYNFKTNLENSIELKKLFEIDKFFSLLSSTNLITNELKNSFKKNIDLIIKDFWDGDYEKGNIKINKLNVTLNSPEFIYSLFKNMNKRNKDLIAGTQFNEYDSNLYLSLFQENDLKFIYEKKQLPLTDNKYELPVPKINELYKILKTKYELYPKDNINKYIDFMEVIRKKGNSIYPVIPKKYRPILKKIKNNIENVFENNKKLNDVRNKVTSFFRLPNKENDIQNFEILKNKVSEYIKDFLTPPPAPSFNPEVTSKQTDSSRERLPDENPISRKDKYGTGNNSSKESKVGKPDVMSNYDTKNNNRKTLSEESSLYGTDKYSKRDNRNNSSSKTSVNNNSNQYITKKNKIKKLKDQAIKLQQELENIKKKLPVIKEVFDIDNNYFSTTMKEILEKERIKFTTLLLKSNLKKMPTGVESFFEIKEKTPTSKFNSGLTESEKIEQIEKEIKRINFHINFFEEETKKLSFKMETNFNKIKNTIKKSTFGRGTYKEIEKKFQENYELMNNFINKLLSNNQEIEQIITRLDSMTL